MYYSNGLSLKYDKKMRKWISNTQLTQQHSYYFSPSCHEIFHHKVFDIYTSWMTTLKCQSLTLCTATQETYNNIPIDCVLINKKKHVFKYLSQHNIQSPIKIFICTLDGHILNKSPHILHLICYYSLNTTFDSLLELLNNKICLYISTDGAQEDTNSGGG